MSSPLLEKSDKELSLLASKHDGDAFDVLVRRHEGYLRAICSRFCDTHHESDDVFQKSCLKAWRAFPKFRLDCHFKSWMYAVVRSVSWDHNSWKKRKAEVSYELNFLDNTTQEFRSSALRKKQGTGLGVPLPSVEWVLDKKSEPDNKLQILDNNKELGTKLSSALSKLSSQHRQCLHCLAEGMTYGEIAKLQQVSLGTVMSRVFYARRNAKKLCYGVKNFNQNV